MTLFPRPALAELDARIARTLAELQQSNGEAYTALLGDLAYLRAMRARVESEEKAEAEKITTTGHTVIGGQGVKRALRVPQDLPLIAAPPVGSK